MVMIDWLTKVWPFYSANDSAATGIIVSNQKAGITQWVCDKGHHNFEHSECETGRCRVCGEVDSMLREKPHYKWSWKLNKAVRL